MVYYLETYNTPQGYYKMDEEGIEILYKYLKWFKFIKIKGSKVDPYTQEEQNELQEFILIINRLFIFK